MQVKRFSWARVSSGWQQFQAWQERRKAMREDFANASSTALSAFGAAWANQISGSSNLAAQSALDRINAAAKSKLDTTA